MHNTELFHVQKFSDNTVIVGCIRRSDEGEYRDLLRDLTSWSHLNNLQLNISKTKEMGLDFRRHCTSVLSVTISGEEVEVMKSCT